MSVTYCIFKGGRGGIFKEGAKLLAKSNSTLLKGQRINVYGNVSLHV